MEYAAPTPFALSGPARRLVRGVGIMLLGCSLLFGYGAFSELAWRVRAWSEGEQSVGTIVGYEPSTGGGWPIVTFQTRSGESLRVRAHDTFSYWTAPPAGTNLQVFYTPDHPRRIHLRVSGGLAQFEWVATPAALAFLFLVCMLLALRCLIA